MRRARVLLACLVFAGMCLLFVDVSGLLPLKLAFLAKIQLVPTVLAGSLITVAALLALTLLSGRTYCSVICPLGVLQDAISAIRGKPRRFRFAPARTRLRIGILALFLAAFGLGIPVVYGLLEPYSAFGRMASSLLAPLWASGNNGLAEAARQADSFLVAPAPVWVKGLSALAAAIATLAVIAVLAWTAGRTWCNTVCPVGTVLGFAARFALYRPRFSARRSMDASRCVSCYNCVAACKRGAMRLSFRPARRTFLAAALASVSIPVLARAAGTEEFAVPALERKKNSQRTVPVLPPGAGSARAFSARCTGCQLCVSACPHQVLRSSDTGLGLLQPMLSFERGYCRVSCVACSAVCPTGAIRPITAAVKSATQIGRATVNRQVCIRHTDNVECTTCGRHCPTGAIGLIEKTGGIKDIAVDAERCTGCGACEYFCPARPLAAIHVEGNTVQRTISS